MKIIDKLDFSKHCFVKDTTTKLKLYVVNWEKIPVK
jgi:hypothetical protein